MQAFFFDASRLRNAFAPRKPRHPLVRVALGLLGVAVLLVLVFASVFVGVATDVVGEDGGGADPVTIQPGDSVRVEGRSEGGYVLASRITGSPS